MIVEYSGRREAGVSLWRKVSQWVCDVYRKREEKAVSDSGEKGKVVDRF